jgi:hypothetical protein
MPTALLSGASTASANLLVNGGFEVPVATSGLNCGGIADCQGFNIADSIGGWTVVGPGPTFPPRTPIVILTNLYNEGGNFFQPQDGNQSLDLTGMSNQGLNGVSQTVATTPGATYSLSIRIGRHAQDANFYNGPAVASLSIDGSPVGTFSNNNTPPPNLLDWEEFTVGFTAAGAATTIALSSAVADLTQNEIGLDNVVLAAIPEPGSLALLAAGLGLFVLRCRRGVPSQARADGAGAASPRRRGRRGARRHRRKAVRRSASRSASRKRSGRTGCWPPAGGSG